MTTATNHGWRVADLGWEQISVVVPPDDVQAAIEPAYRDLDRGPAVLVKAGSFLLWALDVYESARLERVLYGSEVGCRLGDD